MRIDIPDSLPEKFRRPAQYILTAVRESHEVIHAFCHERCVVLIVSDQERATCIRQFTTELLANMAQTTRTFRLRAEGVASLSKPLVAELVSQLGEILELKMNGARDDYADTASIALRQTIDWQCPKTLPFRAYGLNLEAKLSVTPEGAKRPEAHRVYGHEAKQGAPAGDDSGWQVVCRPRVTKVELCRDFARGTCTRGDKCVFRHAKEACRDAARGRCKRLKCKFEHAPKPAAQAMAPSGAERPLAASALLGGSPTALGFNRPGPEQNGVEPRDGASPSSSSSSPTSSIPSPSSPSSSPSSRRCGRGSFSDEELAGSSLGSPTNSPRSALNRSRSWPAEEQPKPGSPRSDWLKPPAFLSPSAAPSPVLGRKRPFARTSTPPATTSPQQQHAASLGAGPRAP